MNQYYIFKIMLPFSRDCFFIFKKVKINFSMVHSRFVNAFSLISKTYVLRFQIFCHIDLGLPSFCFRCGRGGWDGGCVGGGMGGIWNFIQLQCTPSKVKFKGNPHCSNVRHFVLVIKNDDAVLVIQ